MDKIVCELLIEIVKDLEKTREELSGYAYVRTIRNILTGNANAIIAPAFCNKKYYGLMSNLSLQEAEEMMEHLLKTKQLTCLDTNHGRLYCSFAYHDAM